MTESNPLSPSPSFGDDTGRFDIFAKSSLDRLKGVLAQADATSRRAALAAVVAEVTAVVFQAVEDGLVAFAKIDENRKTKIMRCWQPAAGRLVREIETAGSMVPGLSHQDLYVGDLKAAVDSSNTMEEFFARLDELAAKWGSRIKYPMFAGGRRKDLERLHTVVEDEAAKERKKLEGSIDKRLAPELDAARESMNKGIRFGVDVFGGFIADALRLPGDPDLVQQLRWSLVENAHEQLLARLGTKLEPGDEDYQNGIYFAIEQMLLKVFETFRTFIEQSRPDSVTGRHPRSADRIEVIDLEITRANAFLVAYESRLNRLPLSPQVIVLAKRRLRTGDLPTARDQKIFLELCAQLSAGRSFESFSNDKKPVPGLAPDDRGRIVNALKEDVEPIRSLYYVQITLFRYLKGLAQFRKKMA